jgi:hypothetical protein
VRQDDTTKIQPGVYVRVSCLIRGCIYVVSSCLTLGFAYVRVSCLIRGCIYVVSSSLTLDCVDVGVSCLTPVRQDVATKIQPGVRQDTPT